MIKIFVKKENTMSHPASRNQHQASFSYKTLITLFLSLVFSLPLTARASDKTLVLFPLIIYADQPKTYLRQALMSMFVSRLSGGGLEVISDEAFESLLKEEEKKGITSEKRAEELARQIKADYAIFGSITTIGGGYSMDLSMLDLTKEVSKLTRISEAVDEDQFIPKLSDVAYQFRSVIEGIDIRAQRMARTPSTPPEDRTAKGLFFRPADKARSFQPAGKLKVRMGVMAFDTGDLDGDGEPEWAILGRKKLLIYSRRGESPVLKAHLEPSMGEDFLKVSMGDADKNGKAEIYLVSRYGSRARSTVLEWAGGGLKRRDRRPGHMQVVKRPGRTNPLLLFQNSKVESFFSGRIAVMDYDKGGKPVRKDVLIPMKGVQFYTLALFDLDGNGDAEFLGLGEKSRLHVWDKGGKVLWSSDKKIGGTNNAITLGTAPIAEVRPTRIPFNSRIVIADIDRDGKKEVLAINNIPFIEHLEVLIFYRKSNLIAYSIEGTSLVQAWKTRTINYCLMDMQTEGETLFLAALKGKLENISKGSGSIMWFE